jgi:hypothetical protein
MGRFGSAVLGVLASLLLCSLAACSGSGATNITNFPTPASITLNPTPSISLELGKTQQLTATPQNNTGGTITTPVQFVSSNAQIATVSNSGLLCAGMWDSFSAPQVCTPGQAGIAQITAVAKGVSSPPTAVYVHQHIDNIQISLVAGQTAPPSFTNPALQCFSKGQTFNFQATAYSQGIDVTPTAGIFTWQALTQNVATLKAATLSSPVPGLQPGQVQITAGTPGITTVYASVGQVTSTGMSFITCPVQSIAVTVNGDANPLQLVTQNTALAFATTVVDVAGTTITGVPLTWSSSHASIASATGSGDTATGSTPLVGGASITASCTPPTCNLGFQPSRPVYAMAAFDVTVRPSSTSTIQNIPLWVSSTGCGTTDGCVSTTVPITITTTNSIATYTAGEAVPLPATPNSFVFPEQLSDGFLGTDLGEFGSKGLMKLSPQTSATVPGSVTSFPAAPGKILAASSDGMRLVISDTADTPNEVYIFNTSTSSATQLPITGATAAAFSPDNLKAFIAAGSTLYVYSLQDSLQTISLGSPATDVAFLANGIFGYLAGGEPAGGSFLPTCAPASPVVGSINAPGVTMVRALPNGNVLALAPPNIETITPTISGAPSSATPLACPAPVGFITVSNIVSPASGLGHGAFTPAQFLVSTDGSRAYILASNLASVLVFDVNKQTSSAIALAGNVSPVQAALNPAGSLLYVIGSDDQVHILDTAALLDTQQVPFPPNFNFCQDTAGNSFSIFCSANLIAAGH